MLSFAGAMLFGTACRDDMHNQPKIEPLEAHSFFADGMGARHPPAGTVARGQLRLDVHYWEGRGVDGAFADSLPERLELSRDLLERGRDRFEIYCSPCHDSTGSGRGMIVRRGFKPPPPLWEDRLKAMPLGYFFDVMTQGFGVMSSYAGQIPVGDRWAIAAYLRVLQTSQALPYDQLGPLRTGFDTALSAIEADPVALGEDHD